MKEESKIEENFITKIKIQLPQFEYELRTDGIEANLTQGKSKISLYFEKGKSDKDELNLATSIRIRHEELYEHILKHYPNFKPQFTFSIRIGTLGTILNEKSYGFERDREVRKKILPINRLKLDNYIQTFINIFNSKLNLFISNFYDLQGYIEWYGDLLNDTNKTKWLASWRDAYCHLSSLSILNKDVKPYIRKWESMIEEFDKENFQEYCKMMKMNDH